MTYPLLYTDNVSSWRRLWMLWRLYQPMLLPALTWYAVATLSLSLIMGFLTWLSGEQMYTPIVWILSLMMYFAPIMLTRHDYRPISSQLPVTAGEKLTFLLIVFCVIVPLGLIAMEWVGKELCLLVFGAETVDKFGILLPDFTLELVNLPTIMLTNILSTAAIIIIILYYNIKARRNRVAATIISYFAVNVVWAIISGTVGMIYGISRFEGEGAAIPTPDAVDDIVTQFVPLVTLVMLCVTTIVGIIYLRLLYKHLRNSGF